MTQPLRHVPAADLSAATAQTSGTARRVAVSGAAETGISLTPPD